MQVQPKEVLGVRRLVNGTEQVPIVCEELPEDEKTWMGSSVVSQVFPNFRIEDKVIWRRLLIGLLNVCKMKGRKDKEEEGVDVQEGQMASDEEKNDEL